MLFPNLTVRLLSLYNNSRFKVLLNIFKVAFPWPCLFFKSRFKFKLIGRLINELIFMFVLKLIFK